MGNHHSAASAHRSRKNVHWKTAGRPAAPGKPDVIPILSEEEPNAITLRWAPPAHDGGAQLRGYQVECNRLGAAEWVRTAPPVVQRPELLLSGLQPPHRYQFRVAALNAAGRSDYSELSDVLTVGAERALHRAPDFLRRLQDVTALENDKTEFRVEFSGVPPPAIAWFKDDYEIFSSRRTAITTTDAASVLAFHQTLASDEGEIKCTATNRAGHAVSRARLTLQAAPKLRFPRQYEDGLLYEVNETVVLKTTVVGKPAPAVEWRHDGRALRSDGRVQITNSPTASVLKITSAQRGDRGEYQVSARNDIGEDAAAFLVTVTAPPEPPRSVAVARQVDKSVTLAWQPPDDDGGCRVGNYVVEYYRSGWNVWLKATTSRQTSVTLFDLIEGSDYRFRVKAESPYGMSAPSAESASVRIPGEPVDMDFLAVESRIINEALTQQEGEARPVSPAPRRKRASAPPSPGVRAPPASSSSPAPLRKQKRNAAPAEGTSNEFMLVLYPDAKPGDKAEKRKSFQLDLEDALSPPPISLSAPELSSRCVLPFKALRNAVSSTELLHERAMARFYKAVALKEGQEEQKQRDEKTPQREPNHIPYNSVDENQTLDQKSQTTEMNNMSIQKLQTPEILIKSDSLEENRRNNIAPRQNSDNSDKWQQMSFDEDYTASTVSTDGDYTDEDEGDSLTEDVSRESQLAEEEETYHPRNKTALPQPVNETIDEEEEDEQEREPVKPLPVLDPNFIPKPILKKTIPPIPVPTVPVRTLHNDKKLYSNRKQEKLEDKQKKDDKMTLFKKITKQKPFSFPKILNKKDTDKSTTSPTQAKEDKSIKKVETIDDKYGDEGRTVIDYYGNIVKEYGTSKRPTTPIYLNTEDLKQVAEQQTGEDTKTDNNMTNTLQPESSIQPKKKAVKKGTENKVNSVKKKRILSKERQIPPKQEQVIKTESKANQQISNLTIQKKNIKPPVKSEDTRVLLKTTERATIVIPIDYKELEERAKVNVRTAIDYTVDVCLLLLAFWVYFFKDERLAIPFLILIIYRQLQETIFRNIPEWIGRHTPQWLKKKTS